MLDALPRRRGNQIEVFIEVQHYEPGELGCRRDEQIRDRRRSVRAAVGEEQLDVGRRGPRYPASGTRRVGKPTAPSASLFARPGPSGPSNQPPTG